MFEKEAEKWTIDYVCKDCSRYKECKSKEHCTCKDCSKEKWQNGAEFGYNKSKEELNQNGLALQSDMDKTIEQNIALKKENAELKEVTYEDWKKNPTPRMMWVWGNEEMSKVNRKVVYILRENYVPNKVITVDNDDSDYEFYRHCAEIGKSRRMTNKELSWWLTEKPHRERKYARGPYIYIYYTYNENEQDEEVPDNLLIREDDGEWREPLVEE